MTDSRPDLPVIGPPQRRRPMLGSRRRQVVAGLIVAGVLSYLLFQGLTNATVYFKTADQPWRTKRSSAPSSSASRHGRK